MLKKAIQIKQDKKIIEHLQICTLNIRTLNRRESKKTRNSHIQHKMGHNVHQRDENCGSSLEISGISMRVSQEK